MLKKKLYFLVQSQLFLLLLSSGYASQAQIVPDDTLPQNSVVNSDCNTSCQIEGGTTRNGNLFHSFEQFSVPSNGEAVFNNNPQIENIFTRVTGSSISNIDGAIRAEGSANLLLINPNGIVFGANSQLKIGGSFLATTADSILFADDNQFSASNPQSSPLLTVSVPIGLQFGETPGEIVNQSQFVEQPDPLVPFGESVGLKVNDGQTIALIGSTVRLDNGLLIAREGRIELGSVAANSFVDLTKNFEDFILGYDSVTQFKTISIVNRSGLVAGTGTDGNFPSGVIQIQGSLVEFNNSQIDSLNASNFEGGEIFIKAQTLTLQDTRITTQTSGEGKAGNIEVNADSIKLIHEDRNRGSGLISETNSSGKAGNVIVNTNKLTLQNGARLGVSTFSSGDGGNLTVNASESVEVIGKSVDDQFFSGLFAQSEGGNATGNGGNLQINTGRLIVRDGGRISVGAIESSNLSRLGIAQGDGGSLEINATESIEVSGFGVSQQSEIVPSTLLSESQDIGNAGNLEITTPKLTVANRGEVNVNATGTGEAGTLTIDAQDVTLNDGKLTATTRRGDQGNITLTNADTLLLRNNSQINTNAQEQATGGNITLESDTIALLDNSNITANAVKGRGGNIQITTQGIFQESGSQITADSQENIDGEISINSPDVDPTSETVQLSDVPIDAEAILAQNLCKIEGDEIAKGSSFIVTGRGGLIPTSEDFLGNVDNVVRWANRDDLEISQNGLVGVRQRKKSDSSPNDYLVVQQSQGWVTTSDGNVWLVANAPETIPQNAKIVHPDCSNL